MSVCALNWAWESCTRSPSSRLILLSLADHANQDGVCWPSRSRLEERTGLSRSTVKRALVELEEDGFLERDIRCDTGSGRQINNAYRLTMIETPAAANRCRSRSPAAARGGSMVDQGGGSMVDPGGSMVDPPKERTVSEPPIFEPPTPNPRPEAGEVTGGEDLPHDLARDCPRCSSPIGDPCVTRHGAARLPHAARRRRGLTAEQLERLESLRVAWDLPPTSAAVTRYLRIAVLEQVTDADLELVLAWLRAAYGRAALRMMRPSYLFGDGSARWHEHHALARGWQEDGCPQAHERPSRSGRGRIETFEGGVA